MADRGTWAERALDLMKNIEAHCAVRTGTTGAAHADEGRELRERMRALVAEAAMSDSSS